MSNPRNWERHIANIPTLNNHDLSVSAQFHIDDDGTEHRLLILGSHVIDRRDLADLMAALVQASRALNAA